MYDHGVRWAFWRREQASNVARSIGDPAVAQLLIPGFSLLDEINVGETNALQQSPLFRAVALISQTLGSLPLLTYRDKGRGDREIVPSVFDDPDPNGQTQFEWTETLFVHALLHGRAGALKLKNAGGGLAGLQLRHPYTWSAALPSESEYASGNLPAGGVWFDVNLDDGTRRRYDGNDFWYVPSTSLDGRQGVGLLQLARESLKTTIAGERASQRLLTSGAMQAGAMVPADPEEDLSREEDRKQVQRELDATLHGPENAGRIGLLSARLKFMPFALSAVDAQLMQSRQFQVEEISRWTGVPPHALMQTEKQTSWGTGVDEQNRGLGRTVLTPWSVRVEQRGSRLLARPRSLEFDFTSIERSSPDKEREMIRSDWNDDLITLNEARQRMGLERVPGGDRRKSEMTAGPAPADPPTDPNGGPDDPPAE
jgi:HK97 family phage portal protein